METVRHPQPTVAIETITPEMAKQWLPRIKTRKSIPAAMARYRRDISDGAFTMSESAIVFDYDGWITNGSNRLRALAESHNSIQAIVVRGANPADAANYDQHKNRTMSDSLLISCGNEVDNRTTTIINRMHCHWVSAGSKARLTPHQAAQFYCSHKNAIGFALDILPSNSRGVGRADVRAVFGRAYYHERTADLQRMAEILGGAMPQANELTAHTLCRALSSIGRDTDWQYIRRITEAAIVAFCRGVPLKIIRVRKDVDPFPCPAHLEP